MPTDLPPDYKPQPIPDPDQKGPGVPPAPSQPDSPGRPGLTPPTGPDVGPLTPGGAPVPDLPSF